MIIISGKIYVHADKRGDFLSSSHEVILQARNADGCRDFIVAADPVELDRVNVYEEWDTEEQLLRETLIYSSIPVSLSACS